LYGRKAARLSREIATEKERKGDRRGESAKNGNNEKKDTYNPSVSHWNTKLPRYAPMKMQMMM